MQRDKRRPQVVIENGYLELNLPDSNGYVSLPVGDVCRIRFHFCESQFPSLQPDVFCNLGPKVPSVEDHVYEIGIACENISICYCSLKYSVKEPYWQLLIRRRDLELSLVLTQQQVEEFVNSFSLVEAIFGYPDRETEIFVHQY